MVDEAKILAGRNQVDAYRTAHTALHRKPWRKTIPEEHTPLLKALVNALEGLGFTSTETDFEQKKNVILAKFWRDSELLNIQELGFTDMDDFKARATNADMEALDRMWH